MLTNNNPMGGVLVSVGNKTTFTDYNGYFYLSGLTESERVLVNFSCNGFAHTQKITKTVNGLNSYVSAAMNIIPTGSNINSSSGGKVSTIGANVDFPSNAFSDSKGQQFNGTAYVQLTYFNPTNKQFTQAFPGEFIGKRTDGSLTPIESFGFIGVEINNKDNTSEKLNIAAGKTATITISIPSALRAKAPSSILLWYYDETVGQWNEEGSMLKSDSSYIGTVTHFSYWNCDQPFNPSYVRGRLIDSSGNALNFAWAHSDGVDYTGFYSRNSNSSGYFVVPVKANSKAKIWADYYIFKSSEQTVNTLSIGDTLNIGDIIIPTDTSNICIITGRVVDNLDSAISRILVRLINSQGDELDNDDTAPDGSFRFFVDKNTFYRLRIYPCSESSNIDPFDDTITTGSTKGTYDLGIIKVNFRGAYITGRFVDTLNNPISGINCYEYEECIEYHATTDTLGVFRLQTSPNLPIDINYYYNQKRDIIYVTSPGLGSTLNLGNIVVH